MAKNYSQIETLLTKAVQTLGPHGECEAVVVYLVGCCVSILEEPTEERLQEIYGLLSKVVEKNQKEIT